MLRWVILVVAVVFLTAGATLVVQYLPDSEDAKVAVAEVTGPQPEVVVEGDPIFDFGTMSRHDKATHTWLVKNTGQAPLEVWQHGVTTCSCTAANLDPGGKNVFDAAGQKKMVLKPGETKTIELEWHTEKDLGEDYSQGATFGTTDPRKKTFNLSIKGKVYPPVVVFPPQMIQFPRISNEEPQHAKFAVYSQQKPDLKVTKVTSSRPGLIVAEAKPLTADEAKQLKVDKGYMVFVEVKPGMPVGSFHDELVVHTDHPKQPEVKLSIGGKVYGPISVNPPGVRITDVVSRKGASRDLTVLVRDDKGTTFKVAEKPAKLDVSIAPDELGARPRAAIA